MFIKLHLKPQTHLDKYSMSFFPNMKVKLNAQHKIKLFFFTVRVVGTMKIAPPSVTIKLQQTKPNVSGINFICYRNTKFEVFLQFLVKIRYILLDDKLLQ